MEIGAILLGSAVFISTLPYVFGPFRNEERARVPLPRVKAVSTKALKAERDAERKSALLALRDLDFDFRTGKVAEDDYKVLRTGMLAAAARLTNEAEKEDDHLEALIQARRAQIAQGPACANCHTRLSSEDRFCPKCGTPQEQRSCLACGAKLAEADRFCSHCGAAVTKP